MPRRIKAGDVRRVLIGEGFDFSEFDGGDWDPGFRCEQAGTRAVHVFHDGPGEQQHLDTYTTALRDAGYHVVAEQQPRGGRRRLIVTHP